MSMRMSRGAVGLATLALARAGGAAGLSPPPRFVDVAARAGIHFETVSGGGEKRCILESTGSGAAFLDYDQDGHVDLFVASGSTLERLLAGQPGPGGRLYRNRGDGSFEDVTRASGATAPGWAGGVAVADLDNDGWPDLYVTAFGRSYLYRNQGDGTFREQAFEAGIAGSGYMTGAAFADLDGDGILDLVVVRYLALDPEHLPAYPCTWKGLPVFCGPMGLAPAPPTLYLGRGDGTFRDETAARGLAGFASYSFTPLFLDYDGDGREDLFVTNDTAANFLFHNLGDGRFSEVGVLAGVAFNGDGRAQASMGADAQDATGDGLPDLIVTNFSHDTNTLYANSGEGTFRDETADAGLIEPSLLKLGWATAFLDLDDDGLLDLAVVNGHVYPQVDGSRLETTYAQPLQLFRNLGRGRFRELVPAAGDDLARPLRGRGLAVGDIDDDGLLDLAVTQETGPVVLLANRGGGGGGERRGWLRLRLVGRASNRDAIGARVTVRAGGLAQVREHRLTAGYLSSHDPRLLFGLGDAASADVEVRWPSGTIETWRDLAARRDHRLVEGAGGLPDPAHLR